MPRLRIILVSPREAGNVGSAARAMKNFGFDELWIVGEHPQLQPVSTWWASGADDVLSSVRVASTLQEALSDAHLTVATTSMRGRTTPVSFTPKTLAGKFSSLGEHQTLALVFGREDSGLTREEVVLCQQTAAIPTNDGFPTMNLAQSVCLFCYEFSEPMPERTDARELADAATVERMHRRARELLLDTGFLHQDNPDRIYDDLRAIAGRADLDAREAAILLGIIRQIEWKIQAASRGSRSDSP